MMKFRFLFHKKLILNSDWRLKKGDNKVVLGDDESVQQSD